MSHNPSGPDPIDCATAPAPVFASRRFARADAGAASVDDRNGGDFGCDRGHRFTCGEDDGVSAGRRDGRLICCRAAAERGRVDVPLRIETDARESPETSSRAAEMPFPAASTRKRRPGPSVPASNCPSAFEGQGNDVRRPGRVKGAPFPVRRDLVNHALFAGAGVDISLFVERKAPDVLVFRIEKRDAFARYGRSCRCALPAMWQRTACRRWRARARALRAPPRRRTSWFCRPVDLEDFAFVAAPT